MDGHEYICLGLGCYISFTIRVTGILLVLFINEKFLKTVRIVVVDRPAIKPC